MNRMRALFLLLTASVVLSGCNPSDLKPDFLTRSAPPTPTPAPEIVNVDPSLTPRELLTARLINPRDAKSTTPGMTVGKLIEFADRYLACDCSNNRFSKVWHKRGSGYELTTNAAQVRPLQFVCTSATDAVECYLAEIDRGAQISTLSERFMSGTSFISFIYAQGLSCPRAEPCPTQAAEAAVK